MQQEQIKTKIALGVFNALFRIHFFLTRSFSFYLSLHLMQKATTKKYK
jgi:hypothetical protein